MSEEQEEKKIVVAKPKMFKRKAINLYEVATNIDYDDEQFLPQYKTDEAACADIIFNNPNPAIIGTLETHIFDCGFSLEIKPGYKACIVIRSGMAKKGLIIPNSPAQIDSDYRGRVCVLLTNISKENIIIEPYSRVAQLYVESVLRFDFVKKNVETFNKTIRGTGGFGSTGVS
jgi:dUTP pyrophosphatase